MKFERNIVNYGDMIALPLFLAVLLYLVLFKSYDHSFIYYFAITFFSLAILIDGFSLILFINQSLRTSVFPQTNFFYRVIHVIDRWLFHAFSSYCTIFILLWRRRTGSFGIFSGYSL